MAIGDEMLDALADALQQSDVPASDLLARGVAYKLLMSCWDRLTDVIGGIDDISQVINLDGVDPAVLTEAMADVGLIQEVNGEYVCPHALPETPEVVRSRWRRRDPAGYDAAKQRAAHAAKKDSRRRTPLSRPRVSNVDLFGQPIKDDEEEPKKPRASTKEPAEAKYPGHSEFIKWYTNTYEKRFGDKYPFKAADAAVVHRLMKNYPLDRLKQAADAYLKDTSPFTKGHTMFSFERQVTRFLEMTKGAARRANAKARIERERILRHQKSKEAEHRRKQAEDAYAAMTSKERKDLYDEMIRDADEIKAKVYREAPDGMRRHLIICEIEERNRQHGQEEPRS